MDIGWPVATIESEKRRLEFLRRLLKAPDYRLTNTILRVHATRIGVPTTIDQSLGCLAWLSEQELITLQDVGEEPVARLTASGAEVAQGARVHPGIWRPLP